MEYLTDEEMELIEKARELYYEGDYYFEEIANIYDTLDELLESYGITDPMKAIEMCYYGGVNHLYNIRYIFTFTDGLIKEVNIWEFKERLAKEKENILNNFEKVLTI